MEDQDSKKAHQDAAKALFDADVLVLITGAGFSADSGLAVYNDVAKIEAYQLRMMDYMDLCQPHILEEDPQLFYGFWGQCFNDYRSTKPHEGYDIIAEWRNDKNDTTKSGIAEEIRGRIKHKMELRRPFDTDEVVDYTPYQVVDNKVNPAGAFFSFTSNVDAHSFDTFQAQEVYEIHGNIELWQCSSDSCKSGIWRAPIQHSFFVDQESMLAPLSVPSDFSSDVKDTSASASTTVKDQTPRIGHTVKGTRQNLLQNMPPGKNEGWAMGSDAKEEGVNTNWPTCVCCGSLARPAVLMFGDFSWKPDLSQCMRWKLWREALLDLCAKKGSNDVPLKVCILEIGGGFNVPTCRHESETLSENIKATGGAPTLIRINPDEPDSCFSFFSSKIIPIKAKGLCAIQQINHLYQGLRKEESKVMTD